MYVNDCIVQEYDMTVCNALTVIFACNVNCEAHSVLDFQEPESVVTFTSDVHSQSTILFEYSF